MPEIKAKVFPSPNPKVELYKGNKQLDRPIKAEKKKGFSEWEISVWIFVQV
jgi:hypothetical protein